MSAIITRRTRSGRTTVVPRIATEPEVSEVIVDLCSNLEDETSCIDLTSEEDVVDLTAVNDSPIMLLGPGSSDHRRSRAPKRKCSVVQPDSKSDDLPDLPDFEIRSSSKKSAKTDSKKFSSPSKKIICPICLDELTVIQQDKRQLVSTICGHLFCNYCIEEVIRAQRTCPTCRKKLTLKQFHPIFL